MARTYTSGSGFLTTGMQELIDKYAVAVNDPDIVPRFSPVLITDPERKQALADKKIMLIEQSDQPAIPSPTEPDAYVPEYEPDPYVPEYEPDIPYAPQPYIPNAPAQASFGSKTMLIVGVLLIGGGIIYKAVKK